jgi:hypothetical protein
MTAFWDIAPCCLAESDVSVVLTAAIIRAILMMEAVCNSETSVYFSVSLWRDIAKDSHLRIAVVRT